MVGESAPLIKTLISSPQHQRRRPSQRCGCYSFNCKTPWQVAKHYPYFVRLSIIP